MPAQDAGGRASAQNQSGTRGQIRGSTRFYLAESKGLGYGRHADRKLVPTNCGVWEGARKEEGWEEVERVGTNQRQEAVAVWKLDRDRGAVPGSLQPGRPRPMLQ